MELLFQCQYHERKVKAAGAAPRKYIYYNKKYNLQYEINQCET